jgi:hypothetical protein
MASHPRFDAWPSALLDMMAGHRVTAVIYVAACLGIPDELAAGPRTSADLARRTGAHEPSLRRLLRALVTLDVCTESNQHAFELTAVGRYLPGNARQSLKPWVLLEGGFLWHSWGAGDRADNEGFRPSPLPPGCRARLPARYTSGTRSL